MQRVPPARVPGAQGQDAVGALQFRNRTEDVTTGPPAAVHKEDPPPTITEEQNKLQWTWDADKDQENIVKHGINFTTAQAVFEDFYRVTEEDPHPGEQRWRTTGLVGHSVIIVIHTWPQEVRGRIISARRVTRHERRTYEEGNGQTH